LLEGWTVKRLVEAGADGVKLLLYYSTLRSAEINDVKREFVKRVGAECAEADVPFFLELGELWRRTRRRQRGVCRGEA
jgi:tagatose 1,6-diphosphate aldolase